MVLIDNSYTFIANTIHVTPIDVAALMIWKLFHNAKGCWEDVFLAFVTLVIKFFPGTQTWLKGKLDQISHQHQYPPAKYLFDKDKPLCISNIYFNNEIGRYMIS